MSSRPAVYLEHCDRGDSIIVLDEAAGVLASGSWRSGLPVHATLTRIGLVTSIAAGPLLPRSQGGRRPYGRGRRPSATIGSDRSRPPRCDDGGIAFEFQPSRSDQSPGRELLAELIDYFNEIYPGRAARPGSVTTPDEMVAPHGVFLVGYENGEPIAIGGLRPLAENGVCEIKRMYVVPAARSRGAGRALLGALEDAARAIGYQRVRLDAGPGQRHSRALFATAGYVEIERYNENHIADYFAEKRL